MEKGRLQIDVLLLPFMQMSTGHHHVADALIEILQQSHANFVCEKVDILSYGYGPLEKIVSLIYVMWIKLLPNVYDKLYQKNAYDYARRDKRYYMYELLFILFMKKLLKEAKPQIIFCTHALPSYLLSVISRKKVIDSLVVNVYTDFFINNVWGIDGIDYHYVPSEQMKKELLEKGVSEEAIFMTGIPVHPMFTNKAVNKHRENRELSILVTGGSLGIGPIKKILANVEHFHYYVLCGNNDALYTYLTRARRRNITPYRYIHSRQQMNELYDKVDAVLTKPGGVTVSECLSKRKPIFIYNYLPGQEKINKQELNYLGLVISFHSNENKLERNIKDYFVDQHRQYLYANNVNQYKQTLKGIDVTHFTKHM